MRETLPAVARSARVRRRPRPAVCFVVCALAAWSCRGGGEAIQLTLVSGGERVSNVSVRVLVENPPGGILARHTDARGRIRLPAALRGLRVQIGLDCDGDACDRVSPARRIEGDSMTFDVGGGLRLNPSEER
jgi:hypothetical protein